MQSLLTAISTKLSGSALSTAVSGRVYLDEAPAAAAYPNVVYFVVVSSPEKTFTEEYRNTVVQFSLRSTSQGAVEITDLYAKLKALLDDKELTITGSTLVWMREAEGSLSTSVEDITTTAGTVGCKHWAVDYDIKTLLN